MKKRLVILCMITLLLLGTARADFYTANNDSYYHASPACSLGSDFTISEEAARQFRKAACPVCVDRWAIVGEIAEMPVPSNFNLYSADMDADGNLLLAGYSGTPMQQYAYITLASPDGSMLWKQQGGGNGFFYRDANVLADGSIAALINRSADVHDQNWRIQIARNGKIVHHLPDFENIYEFEPTRDGFLLFRRPDTSTCTISKYDNAGNPIWQFEADGFFSLRFLPGENVHLAYGKRAINPEDYQGPSNACAIIFDDNGSILAHIENSEIHSFENAAWCADGGVLLSGLNLLVKYGPDGEELWHRSLEYIKGENSEILVNGRTVRCLTIQDMLPWQDGHLLAIYTDGDYARLLCVDEDGCSGLDRERRRIRMDRQFKALRTQW